MPKCFKKKLFYVPLVVAALLFIALFTFRLHAQSSAVKPGPTPEYFASLGEISKWLPLEGNDGHRPGKAKGAQVRFSADFQLSDDQKRWILHKDVEGCREEANSPCTSCDAGECCSLWLPDNWNYFSTENYPSDPSICD